MSGKISTSHLDRRAIVYVRQSTTAQVIHNGESTARQYALADRARALGWPEQSVEVIDEDLGRSGASTEGRTGVARLAASLARGDVGGLFALEVSRVARSSQDWHQILRLCVVADVVVIVVVCLMHRNAGAPRDIEIVEKREIENGPIVDTRPIPSFCPSV
jgi:hypothetical protein